MKFRAFTLRVARMTIGREGVAGILTSRSPGLGRAFCRLGVAVRQTGQTTGLVGKRLPRAARSGGAEGAGTSVTIVGCRRGPCGSRGGFDDGRRRASGYGEGQKFALSSRIDETLDPANEPASASKSDGWKTYRQRPCPERDTNFPWDLADILPPSRPSSPCS